MNYEIGLKSTDFPKIINFVQNVAASLPPFGMASAFGGVQNLIRVKR
jgi:hypothetical protein